MCGAFEFREFVGEPTIENSRFEYNWCDYFPKCRPIWIKSGADTDRFDYTLVVLPYTKVTET